MKDKELRLPENGECLDSRRMNQDDLLDILPLVTDIAFLYKENTE